MVGSRVHRLSLFGLVASLAIGGGACRIRTDDSSKSRPEAGVPVPTPAPVPVPVPVPDGVADPCQTFTNLSRPSEVVCYINAPIDESLAAVLAARRDRAAVTLFFRRTDREILASVALVPWARQVSITADRGSSPAPVDLRLLAPLVDLRELSIRNALVREVEDAWAFEKLEILYAYEEGVVDLRGARALRHLRDITIGNEVADIGPLAEMPQLEHVWLPGTQHDLAPIGPLSRLSVLSVVVAPSTKLDPLQRLKSLRELSIRGAPPSELASALASLPALTRLFVRGDERITDVRPFATLERLEVLDLGGTRVRSIAPLRALPRLKILTLWDAPVTDLHELPSFPSLERVNLPADTPTATRRELARKMPRVQF